MRISGSVCAAKTHIQNPFFIAVELFRHIKGRKARLTSFVKMSKMIL